MILWKSQWGFISDGARGTHTRTDTRHEDEGGANLLFALDPFLSSHSSLGAWWEMFSPRATLPLAKLHNPSLKALCHLPPRAEAPLTAPRGQSALKLKIQSCDQLLTLVFKLRKAAKTQHMENRAAAMAQNESRKSGQTMCTSLRDKKIIIRQKKV